MNLFLLSLQWPNLQVCALADKLFWNEKRGTCENGAQKISGWIDHGWCHGFPTVFDSLGPRKSFEQSKTWKKIFFSTFQNLLSVDFPLVYDMIILNGHPFSISFGLVRKEYQGICLSSLAKNLQKLMDEHFRDSGSSDIENRKQSKVIM